MRTWKNFTVYTEVVLDALESQFIPNYRDEVENILIVLSTERLLGAELCLVKYSQRRPGSLQMDWFKRMVFSGEKDYVSVY